MKGKLKSFFKRVARILPDDVYLSLRFFLRQKKWLNLKNPQTFNEKLQWLKINDRNPNYIQVVDKYEVRKFIEKHFGNEMLIPLIGGAWKSTEEIDFSALPNEFVLKCTHDSGGLIICKNKEKLDIPHVKRKLGSSLRTNYYWGGREWPYKNVVPQIIAEKYMQDMTKRDLMDYKFFVFGGICKCIQVDYDRFTNHHRNFYTTEWEYMNFTTCYPTDKKKKIEAPKNLNGMIKISERISELLDKPAFIRVDLYEIDQQIFFGEITFYHGSGMEKFIPAEWDKKLGDWIELPIEENTK